MISRPCTSCLWLGPWLLASVAGLLPVLGHAQVQRCTDPHTGHVTYTDSPCAAGERQVLIAPAPTPQERAAHEAAYQQALQRRQAEQALEAERAAARQAELAAEAARHAPAPTIVQVPVPVNVPTPAPVGAYPHPGYAPPVGLHPPGHRPGMMRGYHHR